MKARAFVTAVLGLAALVAVGSCTDEFHPLLPYQVGAIEGFVTSSGSGVSVTVSARAISANRPGAVIAETESDTTGWYRLELPSGLYRLEVDDGTCGVSYSDRRDTVRVATDVRHHDLTRVRAEISVALPPELEGRSLRLRLSSRRYGSCSVSQISTKGALHFVWPLLQPDSYAMSLTAAGVTNTCWLPGTTDDGAADSLRASSDSIVRYSADLRSSYASISGRITGSWQAAGVGRPQVEAVSDSTYRGGSVPCGSDGSFTLGFFAPEVVRLSTEIEGVEQWIGGDSFTTARRFELQPGLRIEGVSVVESGLAVRLEGPDEVIYHDASIMVRDEAGRDFSPWDARGNLIHVCNLRPGRYRVFLDGRCANQVWMPQWYDGAERPEDATPIDLAPGELRQIVCRLVVGGRIEGELLTAGGSAALSAYVRLRDADGVPVCSYSQATEMGLFGFAGLADGQYYLEAGSPGLEPWWWPGTPDPDAAAPITIVDHGTVTGLVWSLPPPKEVWR